MATLFWPLRPPHETLLRWLCDFSVTMQKIAFILVTFGAERAAFQMRGNNQDVRYVTGEHFVFIMLNRTTYLHCVQYKPFTNSFILMILFGFQKLNCSQAHAVI